MERKQPFTGSSKGNLEFAALSNIWELRSGSKIEDTICETLPIGIFGDKICRH